MRTALFSAAAAAAAGRAGIGSLRLGPDPRDRRSVLLRRPAIDTTTSALLLVTLFVSAIAAMAAEPATTAAGAGTSGGADAGAPEGTGAEAPKEPMLAIMGKRFPLDLMGGELTVHGTPVFIQEKANSGEGTAHTVWDGGVVLAKYLEHRYPSGLVGHTVLELGAGTGIVGVVASVLGASHVYLTDLPYALENLEAVAQLNKHALHGKLECVALDWTDPPAHAEGVGGEDLSLVLASDVVWVPELITPLVNTLAAVTDTAKPAMTIIAHQTRSTASDTAFFDALREAGFTVREVPHEEQHAEFSDPAIHIFELTRAPRTEL